MKIELREIPIREVFDGYVDNPAEEHIVGYGGRLNIRPKYQRNMCYDLPEQRAVIDTIRKGFPLNVMYRAKSGEDQYELLDGQQRTLSFCRYLDNALPINDKYFHSLTLDEKDQILNYKLMIYVCEGTESEKLAWFRIINIAGKKLEDQELLNAAYTGSWLTDAKRHFSKEDCPAFGMANQYMGGDHIRQKYLETALKWISARDGDTIEGYMSKHQHDDNASELWLYFKDVIHWVEGRFPVYRKEMKGLPWGLYYNKYHDLKLDPDVLERRIKELVEDEDVTKNAGIYEYLLDGDVCHLSIRAFTPKMRRAAYEKQNGKCVCCGKSFKIEEMHADHIIPWHKGGHTTADNCQMLCAKDNWSKSGK